MVDVISLYKRIVDFEERLNKTNVDSNLKKNINFIRNDYADLFEHELYRVLKK